MPYNKKNIKKSIAVGIIVLLLDLLGHFLFTARAETFMYYLWKPVIAGYVAYVYYNFKSYEFLLKLYASAVFSILHGGYYRIIDFFQGNPFWSRVQDIALGETILFSRNSIIASTIGWGIIHGGVFLISIFIADYLAKKRIL